MVYPDNSGERSPIRDIWISLEVDFPNIPTTVTVMT